jgi:FAD:protein FMN transferase
MAVLVEKAKPHSLVKEKQHARLCFQAFGTNCSLLLPYFEHQNLDLVSRQVVVWVNNFEQRYSRYLEDSWVTEVNRSAGKKAVSITAEDFEVLRAATFTFFQSKHAIDPSCLPLTQLWQKAKAIKKVPNEDQILEACNLVNWEWVEYTQTEIFLPQPGMGLDFGGFGKEWAVDKIAGLLKSHGHENFLINFGGDIFGFGKAGGNETWKVGIEKPDGEGQAAYVVALKNHALASSGNYRKFFDISKKRYGHTLDPRTGYPTIHSDLSASIISPSCLKSGILSTTCLLNERETGMRMIEAEWDTEGCIQSIDSSCTSNKFYDYVVYENCS